MLKKLELGCGDRPTPGYLHQDIIALTALDFYCNPWEVDLPENSLDEAIAAGVMEHLRFEDFRKTVKHIHKLLKPDGIFLFDVPDLHIWSEYLYNVLRGEQVPFTKEHILSTFWGWQRWEGDEHKSGWTLQTIRQELSFGFKVETNIDSFTDVRQMFKDRGIVRNRFDRPEDAHIYIKAIK